MSTSEASRSSARRSAASGSTCPASTASFYKVEDRLPGLLTFLAKLTSAGAASAHAWAASSNVSALARMRRARSHGDVHLAGRVQRGLDLGVRLLELRARQDSLFWVSNKELPNELVRGRDVRGDTAAERTLASLSAMSTSSRAAFFRGQHNSNSGAEAPGCRHLLPGQQRRRLQLRQPCGQGDKGGDCILVRHSGLRRVGGCSSLHSVQH